MFRLTNTKLLLDGARSSVFRNFVAIRPMTLLHTSVRISTYSWSQILALANVTVLTSTLVTYSVIHFVRAPRPETHSCQLLTLTLATLQKKKKNRTYPLLSFLLLSFSSISHIFYPLSMDHTKLPKTVTIVLNGHNYVLWVQDIRSFLKGHLWWRYVTSDIQPHVRFKDEDETNFSDCLDD